MELFLMVAAISVLGLALSAIAFSAATRDVRTQPDARPQPERAPVERAAVPATRFFVDVPVDPAMIRAPIPVELLLAQIERHVRLEQAAAQSYLVMPTPESLHMTTTSPLVH
jgi:hypothetical protein